MIYFIQAADGTGPIKIGKTVNVPRRLSQLEIQTDLKLKVLYSMPGYTQEERQILKTFSLFHIKREWHEPDQSILDFIKAGAIELPKVQPRVLDQQGPKIFNIQQASILLGLGSRTITRLIHDNRFPGAYRQNPYGATSSWLIPESAIIAFEEMRRETAI